MNRVPRGLQISRADPWLGDRRDIAFRPGYKTLTLA